MILTGENINRAEWSELVRTSTTGTWFQSPEAYLFFSAQKELFSPFAIAVAERTISDERLVIRGICVGYVTVEKNPLKQFFTRRAIIVGGPCLANDAADEEVTALMKAVKGLVDEGISGLGEPIYIETRNFNDYSRWKDAFAAAGFEYQPHLNFHVDTSSVEIVESNLGKSRKRDIKTTIRDGAVIIEQPTIKQVQSYYALLENLYRTKVKTPLFPLSFFEQLWRHQDGRFLLIAISRENGEPEIIGGTVCIAQEGKCLYEWFVCGRDGEWKTIFPSSYATYAGIRYAAEHNMPRFDMMGAGKPDEAYGVRDFKARFGGKEVEHGRFLCITKQLLYKVGILGVKLLKKIKWL